MLFFNMPSFLSFSEQIKSAANRGLDFSAYLKEKRLDIAGDIIIKKVYLDLESAFYQYEHPIKISKEKDIFKVIEESDMKLQQLVETSIDMFFNRLKAIYGLDKVNARSQIDNQTLDMATPGATNLETGLMRTTSTGLISIYAENRRLGFNISDAHKVPKKGVYRMTGLNGQDLILNEVVHEFTHILEGQLKKLAKNYILAKKPKNPIGKSIQFLQKDPLDGRGRLFNPNDLPEKAFYKYRNGPVERLAHENGEGILTAMWAFTSIK